MGKRIQAWGESRTDRIVKEWLAARNIPELELMSFRIVRGNDLVPTIELTMFFDDEPETEGANDGIQD